jgi:hypothetical protein
MPDVLIVSSLAAEHEQFDFLPDPASQMVAALQRTILSGEDCQGPTLPSAIGVFQVKVISPGDLNQVDWQSRNSLICPLTLDLPDRLLDRLSLPEQHIYRTCQTIADLRHTVAQWQYAVGDGDFWLPIVWTARGPLYAEAIGKKQKTENPILRTPHSALPHSPLYVQPIHMSDRW